MNKALFKTLLYARLTFNATLKKKKEIEYGSDEIIIIIHKYVGTVGKSERKYYIIP